MTMMITPGADSAPERCGERLKIFVLTIVVMAFIWAVTAVCLPGSIRYACTVDSCTYENISCQGDKGFRWYACYNVSLTMELREYDSIYRSISNYLFMDFEEAIFFCESKLNDTTPCYLTYPNLSERDSRPTVLALMALIMFCGAFTLTLAHPLYR